MEKWPDGLIVVAKRDCPTCVLVEPLLREIAAGPLPVKVLVQDDPSYAADVPGTELDATLEKSFRLGCEYVPTLIRIEGGRETARTYGWHRGEWRALTGMPELGTGLPELRLGCASKTLEAGIAEQLELRFGGSKLASRRVELGDAEDPWEACWDRGWSDGLPVVPPTPERVLRMLGGTARAPSELLGTMPPDLTPCTVEKVAINAVMAGCKPEYMPIVLAAVEAALDDAFGLHGVLATTMFVGPIVVVNGPIAKAVGINAGVNALGQGHRANSTIGRALQLVVRNVGGGRPGEVDRAALGAPGKVGFCFAELEDGRWEPLSVQRGFAAGKSTVTLFAGGMIHGIVDQKSRTPESLARSFAACLRAVDHPKLAMTGDALLVVSPDHARVFHDAGWSKAKLMQTLDALLLADAGPMMAGEGGIDEGLPASLAGRKVPKFRPGGLMMVKAGGGAGKFSAIIVGWLASGPKGSVPVTREIVT